MATRYETFDTLGTHHYATVHEGQDVEGGGEVAVYELHRRFLDDPSSGSSIWQQVRTVAAIRHEGLVRVLDTVERSGWVVTELMAGNLRDALARGPVASEVVRGILRQILEALAALHAQGVIHGDVRPSSILHDSQGRVKLAFSPGLFLGNTIPERKKDHKYLAPETLERSFGEPGPALDLYTLGFSALEALVGPGFDRQFKGIGDGSLDGSMAWLRWHGSAGERLPALEELVPSIEPDVARVLARCLEKEVAPRYAGAEAALADLKAGSTPLLDVSRSRRPSSGRGPSRPADPDDGRNVVHIIRPDLREDDPAGRRPEPARKPRPESRGGEAAKNPFLEKLQTPQVSYTLAAVVPVVLFLVYVVFFAKHEQTVRIVTDPAGATVFLKSDKLSRPTPASGVLKFDQPYEFRFELPGYEPRTETLMVKATESREEPVVFEFTLKALPRKVSLGTEPAGARVVVGGAELPGRTPLEVMLEPATYEVGYFLEAHEEARDRLEVLPGALVQAVPPHRLEPMRMLEVRVQPPDARLEIDGQPAPLEEGVHRRPVPRGAALRVGVLARNHAPHDARTFTYDELTGRNFALELALDPVVRVVPFLVESLRVDGTRQKLDDDGDLRLAFAGRNLVRIQATAEGFEPLDETFSRDALAGRRYRIALRRLADDSKVPVKPRLPEGAIEPPAGMEYVGPNAQGFFEYRNLKDRSVMILVPKGTFRMGSGEGYADERPPHDVLLDAYLIDKFEVTNAMYRAFLKETGRPPSTSMSTPHLDGDEHPVTGITWESALAYCQWVGKRLPTEAEWEKAARGSDGRMFPWGGDLPAAGGIFRANFRPVEGLTVGYPRSAPVGRFPAGVSPYGVHDLAGNALEWCADWYDEGYYAVSPAANPTGPALGQRHVIRGGSWSFSTDRLRSSCRRIPEARSFQEEIGFRGVRAAP